MSILMTGCSKKASYDDYEKVSMTASWTYNYGSVEELSKASDIVAVVKITDSECKKISDIPLTTFDAQVKQLICGNDEKEIKITMTGGIDKTEKKIYELDDDPLMQINDEYLIFSNKNSDGTYTTLSGSQGRFEIEGNSVYSLNKSNAQVKKANVGSNIKVSGEDKETFIKSIRAYTR